MFLGLESPRGGSHDAEGQEERQRKIREYSVSGQISSYIIRENLQKEQCDYKNKGCLIEKVKRKNKKK
jgi:hypothetical protein